MSTKRTKIIKFHNKMGLLEIFLVNNEYPGLKAAIIHVTVIQGLSYWGQYSMFSEFLKRITEYCFKKFPITGNFFSNMLTIIIHCL
jgi:hypothetical protein